MNNGNVRQATFVDRLEWIPRMTVLPVHAKESIRFVLLLAKSNSSKPYCHSAMRMK